MHDKQVLLGITIILMIAVVFQDYRYGSKQVESREVIRVKDSIITELLVENKQLTDANMEIYGGKQ